MERYKAMTGSKGKSFVLQHCYTVPEHCPKWKARDQEIKPKKEHCKSWMIVRMTLEKKQGKPGGEQEGQGEDQA
jgi:hypothetical protein